MAEQMSEQRSDRDEVAQDVAAVYRKYAPLHLTGEFVFVGDSAGGQLATIVGSQFGRRNVAANPEFSNAYKPLIAALGHLDRKEEAAPYVAKLLELEPHFTAEYFGRIYPIQKPQDRNRYIQGLIAAGVPPA